MAADFGAAVRCWFAVGQFQHADATALREQQGNGAADAQLGVVGMGGDDEIVERFHGDGALSRTEWELFVPVPKVGAASRAAPGSGSARRTYLGRCREPGRPPSVRLGSPDLPKERPLGASL